MNITTVGIDLAKNVFQVHAVDERGKAVLRKQLRRTQVVRIFANLPPCLIGMEACGSAHYWGRTLQRFGHTVRLIATAVRQAVREDEQERCGRCGGDLRGGRPTEHALCADQERRAASDLALHRVRQGFVKARTAQANQIRGLLGEIGTHYPPGHLRNVPSECRSCWRMPATNSPQSFST